MTDLIGRFFAFLFVVICLAILLAMGGAVLLPALAFLFALKFMVGGLV